MAHAEDCLSSSCRDIHVLSGSLADLSFERDGYITVNLVSEFLLKNQKFDFRVPST